MTTICKNCRHHVNNMSNPNAPDVWYNQVCAVHPLPTKVDPVSGDEKPYGTNSLGKEYVTDEPFRFCRDINHGHCPKFEPKVGLATRAGQCMREMLPLKGER